MNPSSRATDPTPRGPGREDRSGQDAADRRQAAERESARFVAFENAAAARHSDAAREAFAILVEEAIEGGKAAIIRPEVRQDLVLKGEAQGLRPFEAQLTIAMVQDAARHGEVVRRVPPKSGHAVGVQSASSAGHALRPARHFTSQLVLAIVMGMVIFAALVVAVLRA